MVVWEILKHTMYNKPERPITYGKSPNWQPQLQMNIKYSAFIPKYAVKPVKK